MTNVKNYAIRADQIKALAEGYGACFATDEITVKGRKIGFAYREEPDNDMDSGWRFSAGDEDDDYMDDPDNHGIFDVNTIANFDPDIVALLDAPVGSHFVREDGDGAFEAVEWEED